MLKMYKNGDSNAKLIIEGASVAMAIDIKFVLFTFGFYGKNYRPLLLIKMLNITIPKVKKSTVSTLGF